LCVSELVGLREVTHEIQKLGGRVLAISVDRPEDSARVVESRNLNFQILADVDRKVITAYGLVHKGGGQGGVDIALPAHVLIDQKGRIAWRHLAKRYQDRPYPATIQEEIRKLK
jgi:peroxiredoxin